MSEPGPQPDPSSRPNDPDGAAGPSGHDPDAEQAARDTVDQATEAAAAMDDATRAQMLGGMLKASFNMIRLTDRKAQTLLRINLTLMGVAFIGVPPSVAALKKFAEQGGWFEVTLFSAVLVLYVMTALCLIGAVMKIIRVIRPRGPELPQRPSKFYHAAIVGHDYEGFRQMFRGMDQARVCEEMMLQLYHSAYITHAKCRRLNEAIGWMLGGGLAGVLFAIILMISYGLT